MDLKINNVEANIIGNGFFNKTKINNTYPCVTCNFLNLELNPIATIVCDFKALSTINLSNIKTKIIVKHLDNEINYPKGTILFASSKGLNSGQLAAEYLIKLGFNKLNLYGITSRFEVNLDSESDKYYPKDIANIKPRIYKWNKMWDTLIMNNPTVEFNFIK